MEPRHGVLFFFFFFHSPVPQFVLSENPDIECYTGEWKSFFLPASIAVGVLWVALLPILTAAFSVRAAYRVKWAFKQRDRDSHTMAKLDRNVNRDIARFGCAFCSLSP